MTLTNTLLLSLSVICLAGVCQCQRSYYCDSNGVEDITDTSFKIFTRKAIHLTYEPGIFCKYLTRISGRYFVEINVADTDSAVLEVKSDNTQVLKTDSSNLKYYQRSLFVNYGQLTVTFQSYYYESRYKRGFELQVTRVTDCPPGWVQISNNCFGSSRMSSALILNYSEAQKSCNSMRSNLLHMPSDYSGDVASLWSDLPSSLRSNAWIGITDIDIQTKPYWLSGSRFYSTQLMKCNGYRYSSTNCNSNQRCAAFVNSVYTSTPLYMERCSRLLSYVCWMPLYGTDRFYNVPDYSKINDYNYTYFNIYWIFYALGAIGAVAVVGFLIFAAVRSSSRNRSVARRSAIGAVPAPPPGTYPTQLPPAYTVTVGRPQQVPIQQPYHTGPAPPPPTYNSVAGDGNNQAFRY